eukprot:3368679-Alexandrium_andersonii.AAC.1
MAALLRPASTAVGAHAKMLPKAAATSAASVAAGSAAPFVPVTPQPGGYAPPPAYLKALQREIDELREE